MAKSNIPRIDDLLAGTGADLSSGDTSPEASAAIQELLHGHGYKTPLMRGRGYQTFNDSLKRTVKAFRTKNGLGSSDVVDNATLSLLLKLPASRPVVSRPYLTLALDIPYSGYAKLVSIVAIVEGAGKFGAMALNPDSAGLSIGIIQWAQKPKRLLELVQKFDADAQTKQVVRPLLGFKVDDDAGFNALVAHLNTARGGTNKDGSSTNTSYNLIVDPWKSKFRSVCLSAPLQKVQVRAAIAAFKASHEGFPGSLALLKSEKSVALALDIANQFGDGGLSRLAKLATTTTPADETDLQKKLAAEAFKKIQTLFPKQPAFAKARDDRSTFILNDAGLSDSVFTP